MNDPLIGKVTITGYVKDGAITTGDSPVDLIEHMKAFEESQVTVTIRRVIGSDAPEEYTGIALYGGLRMGSRTMNVADLSRFNDALMEVTIERFHPVHQFGDPE